MQSPAALQLTTDIDNCYLSLCIFDEEMMSEIYPDTGRLAAVADQLFEGQRRKNNPADYIHERLATLISSFQSNLADDVEVGINVVGSGAAAPFRLRAMTVSNPDILIFDGIDDHGAQVRLLQHYTQTAIMLVVMPKVEEKPYRIGFT